MSAVVRAMRSKRLRTLLNTKGETRSETIAVSIVPWAPDAAPPAVGTALFSGDESGNWRDQSQTDFSFKPLAPARRHGQAAGPSHFRARFFQSIRGERARLVPCTS